MGRLTEINSAARGFTIVELLIVVIVIGILATVSLVSYNGFMEYGYRSQRIADVTTVQRALELYKKDNGYYPANGADNWGGALNSTQMQTALTPYLKTIPTEPTGNPSYAYSYVRGSYDNYGIIIFWSNTPLPGCHWTDISPCKRCKIGRKLDVGTNPAGGVYASWGTTVGCPGFKSGLGY